MDIINIAISIDCENKFDKYIKYATSLLVSIFEQTIYKVHIHILHNGNFPKYYQENIKKISYRYEGRVYYYKIETDKIFFNLDTVKKYSPAVTNKFYIAEILKVKKVIHLDLDIILKKDIGLLWEIDLKDNYIAGVNFQWKDTIKELCFPYGGLFSEEQMLENRLNAGVLMFNLEKIRKDFSLIDEAKKFCEKYINGKGVDEEFFLYIFNSKTIKLDEKYNYLVSPLEERKKLNFEDIICLHYMFHVKPLNCYIGDEFDIEFWKNYTLTPCYSFDDTSNLLKEILNQKKVIMSLIACSGKKIIISGSGGMAKFLMKNYKDSLINLKYFTDSDEAKWEKKFFDYDIKSPKNILNENKEDIIVLVCMTNTLEFEKYLQDNNFFKNINYFCICDLIDYARV